MDDTSRPPNAPLPNTASLPPGATSDDDADWTGQVLGEFRVLHRLGRGGMGQVYLAEQTSLKRKVALKLLNPDLAGNQRALARFKTEALNVAQATHANIVQIYVIGEANGQHYIALEYVEGKNLGEFIIKKGTPEIALGLHIMTQVASALQRASELGLIHRDIKPENILLTKKGEVKVADFGLSREFAEGGGPSLTLSQVTMGTPLYMSPEQVERRSVDPRTDIYSFGVTCYHMFAGHPPFRGTSPVDVAYKHVHEDPQPLSAIRPDLPLELCSIIHKMMAKKPEDRYQTAREIVRDINHLRETLNLGAGAVSISASFLGSSGAMRNSTQTYLERPRSYAWLWFGAVVTVLLALGGGGALGWLHNHPEPEVKDHPKPDVQPLPLDLTPEGRKPKTDESELRKLAEKYPSPTTANQVILGLEHWLDLSAFYLHERRYSDADAVFKELSKSDRVLAYRMLGEIGQAMVLAYKDEPDASNKAFVPLMQQFEKLEKYAGKFKVDPKFAAEVSAYDNVWRKDARVREMVAQALNRNHTNSPATFPALLNAYRIPPRPVLKKDPPAPMMP